MMRGMRALVVLLVFACGHAPPKPAAVEQPVTSIADIAGIWIASDELDWAYKLSVEPTGAIALVIDRNKMGICEQKGTLAAGSEPKSFQLTYERNECNRDYAGAVLQMKIASFTGDALTVVITGYGSEERRTYTRARRPL